MKPRIVRTLITGAVASMVIGTSACAVNTQQEVAMGADYAGQINQQLPLIRDPQVMSYINVLGDSIAKLADDRSLTWHFYVVDDRNINAFAVPGGYVYVNRGLIERASNVSELASVLGHEIGHVTRRHSIQQMQKGQTANVGVALGCILAPAVCNSQAGAAAVQVGGSAVFASFSRHDESEADIEGIKNAVRAGIDPRGMVTMFQTLLEERQRRPSGVEVMFASHPLEEQRIRDAQAAIDKINPAILRTLTKDSPRFQTFKRRLQSLPPSPAPRG